MSHDTVLPTGTKFRYVYSYIIYIWYKLGNIRSIINHPTRVLDFNSYSHNKYTASGNAHTEHEYVVSRGAAKYANNALLYERTSARPFLRGCRQFLEKLKSNN